MKTTKEAVKVGFGQNPILLLFLLLVDHNSSINCRKLLIMVLKEWLSLGISQ